MILTKRNSLLKSSQIYNIYNNNESVQLFWHLRSVSLAHVLDCQHFNAYFKSWMNRNNVIGKRKLTREFDVDYFSLDSLNFFCLVCQLFGSVVEYQEEEVHMDDAILDKKRVILSVCWVE